MAQIDGLPTLTSASAALSISGYQPTQSPNTSSRRRQERISELEASWSSPPPYRPQAPLAPPAPDRAAPDPDTNVQIRRLQREVSDKEVQIRRLEQEIEDEKDEKRRLRAERHDAVDAQRRAKDELWRLETRVAKLDELLDASIKREKELESELDAAREEVAKLKRRLHEERSSYESDIRAKDIREKRIEQQLEDSQRTLEEEVERNRILAASVADRQVQAEAPRRSRKSDRRTSGVPFVSVPLGGSRSRLYMFT